ncbi:MAG: PAS domain S-box protein [Bacteroidales bacterium]|nr:PAS domain S-box protein [Bacteroidales bacterium]
MKEKLPGIERLKPVSSPINGAIAWIILLVALTLTAVFSYTTKQWVEENARKDFSFECNEIKGSVQARLHTHAALLRTGAAFIESCDTVSRKEWEVFIANQKTERNLPGVQGLGYAMIVSGKKLKEHEQDIRNSGFPDYKIKPEGKRDIYTSIIYIEPFTGRNLKAFGYDMFSEPIRRQAMEKARDLNIASLSGKVQLVQETNTDIQAGTLMYVPVYRQGMPISTVAERRAAIKGWSYSPYRMNDFMLGVLGNYANKLKGSIRLQIYDNDSIVPEALLFDSQAAKKNVTGTTKLELKLPLIFNGKHWTLYFFKNMELSSFYLYKDVIQVLSGGLALSFLIFMLALQLLKNRYRLKLTTQLARNLQENLDKHVALYNAIPDAVFVSDSDTGLIEEINHKASEQYGYTYDEFIGHCSSDIKFLTVQPDSSELNSEQFIHDQFHKKKDNTIFPVEISSRTFEYGNAQKIITVARDISDRIKAETELSLKNEAFENSIAAQGITDTNGVFTHVNQAFVKMSGYETDTDVIGKSIDSFFAEKEGTAKDLEILFTTGSWQGEFRAMRRDGSIFITKAFATTIRNKQSVTIGYQTTSLDITKEKEAEHELLKSKERSQTLVENVNDAIAVSGPETIIFANQKFLDLLEYSEKEVLSGTYLQYLHPDDKNELIENYLKLFEGKPLHKYPARIITKTGSIKWVEFSGIVIEWDGQIAVLSFITDITERKKAQDALMVSEELYKSTIKASPDVIADTDLEGRILMVSPAVLPFFGFDNADEIIGRQILEFVVPADRAKAITNIDLLINGKGLGPECYKCQRKDGSIVDGEINGEIIHDANGQPKGFVFILRDITERKRIEKTLQESEEKWRSLVSNSPDYIALHDKDGKYLFLNHFAEGFSEKDILGHSIYEFLAPETKDLFKLKYNESISTWRAVKFEHIALGNNGEMRVYEESFVPVLTKNEEVNVLAVAKDITEQKLAERKLKEREEHFRLIFEDGSIAMALVNADFRFSQVNKAFVALLGYSEAELRNMTFAEITDPEFIEQDLQEIKRLLNHEIALYRTEKKYLTRFKKKVWGLVHVSVMYNKTGEFLSLLVTINNITERKRAEESLLESQEIFNQFMLNSPIYVFFKDKQIRALRLSRNFEQMLGRPLDELLGKTMDEIFPSKLAKNMIADDLKILHEGKQIELEEEMNGRYYSTTKFPIFIEGKPMYLAGYSIDITSRKLAGDTIKAALHEKEILLREVHHRVKNNLQVVSSLLNLQANKIADKSIKEILEQSRNRIRSIALVHEKLYQTGNFAEINIKEYSRSLVAELFRVYLADPQKIHIRTEIEDVNIPLVYAIPYGLILNEIISNSLKYAFPKDRVTKQKPEIFIKLKTLPDKYLQICTGDNGIGLPDDYSVTDSLSLGLYLIRILATEQLDGEIEIDNKKGTIFTITFNPYPVYDKK